jgi:hypothetical protein
MGERNFFDQIFAFALPLLAVSLSLAYFLVIKTIKRHEKLFFCREIVSGSWGNKRTDTHTHSSHTRGWESIATVVRWGTNNIGNLIYNCSLAPDKRDAITYHRARFFLCRLFPPPRTVHKAVRCDTHTDLLKCEIKYSFFHFRSLHLLFLLSRRSRIHVCMSTHDFWAARDIQRRSKFEWALSRHKFP